MSKISDIDWDSIKSNFINSLPSKKITEKENGKIKSVTYPQELVDQSFDALMQDLVTEIPVKYIDKEQQADLSNKKVLEFLANTQETDRFQSENVILSTDLWHKLMETPKKNICSNYFRRCINIDKHRVNYSELLVLNDDSALPVMTTLQFDFENSSKTSSNVRSYVNKSMSTFNDLLSLGDSYKDPNQIKDLAEETDDYSIHQYYLPAGISNDALSQATLLMRYDHCFAKHKNGSMPPLFKNVFPEYVEEPHFHFNCGFGGIYKLTNDSETNNVGVGYAIGVTQLCDYLTKLYNKDYGPNEEELYENNDFGMPFLKLHQESNELLEPALKCLILLKMIKNSLYYDMREQELKLAYLFCNTIAEIPLRSLDFYNPYLGKEIDEIEHMIEKKDLMHRKYLDEEIGEIEHMIEKRDLMHRKNLDKEIDEEEQGADY